MTWRDVLAGIAIGLATIGGCFGMLYFLGERVTSAIFIVVWVLTVLGMVYEEGRAKRGAK